MMSLRLRKVCKWIVFIQILLIFIHLNFLISVADIDGFSSKSNKSTSGFFTSSISGISNRLLAGAEKKDSDIGKNENKSGKGGNITKSTVPLEMVTSRNITKGSVPLERVTRRHVRGVPQICTGMEFPGHLDNLNRWQPVNSKTAFVFSAYFVERGNKVIIIGAVTTQQQIYFCIVWRKETWGYSAKTSIAKVTRLPEDHRLRYSGVMFECALASFSGVVSYISLDTDRCRTPSNLLKLQMTTKPDKYPRRFTVCLTPLNTQYRKAYELVEWIELNRILGAEKFVIYNHSSAENVLKVIDFYRENRLVEVVQWQLPMDVRTFNRTKRPEIHYFGQIIALQDCLYRNKIDSEFIVNTDLDEFIIPRGNNVTSWTQMLKHLSNTSGAYLFLNTFFRKEWENTFFSNMEKVNKYKLVTLQKLHHEEKIYPVKLRSKYFARTEMVSRVMIHSVIYLPAKHIAQPVPEEIGLLHHYRDWENEFTLPERKVFDDTVPRKYGETLLKNVELVWSHLRSVQMN